jgi:hypothetical protein
LELWEYRRFDGHAWTFEVADALGRTGNWFDHKETLELAQPPTSPAIDITCLVAEDPSEVLETNQAELTLSSAPVVPHLASPDVYSGWAEDPLREGLARYVSGGQYTPFVWHESEVVLFGNKSSVELVSQGSSAQVDQTVPWIWPELLPQDERPKYEDLVYRLNAIPPELLYHVANGRSYSNPFWSDNVLVNDIELSYRGVVLCLEHNRQYHEIWKESRLSFFPSFSLKRAAVRLNRTPMNQEIIRIFKELHTRSVHRYLSWRDDLAVSNPDLFANVILYEQQERLLEQQRQNNALLQTQVSTLRQIQRTQQHQLSVVKDEARKNDDFRHRWGR